ncbi:hypothetical protein Rwratislav_27244 [Rhodococcus wratislaviensis IFP 2016]|nr:hypothetical protein Rwratislav_27244 [Rhodococcus wratislaviensis IFP 2016]
MTPVAGLGNDVSLDCRGAVSSRSAAAPSRFRAAAPSRFRAAAPSRFRAAAPSRFPDAPSREHRMTPTEDDLDPDIAQAWVFRDLLDEEIEGLTARIENIRGVRTEDRHGDNSPRCINGWPG